MERATPLVFEIVEGALAACFREIGVEIERPFRRLPYADAIAKYGSDKPDLRFGMEIQDFGPAFAHSAFGIFREAVEHGGTIRGFVIPGAAKYSRREVDELVEQAKQAGAAGLVYARYTAEGVQVSAKPIGEEGTRKVLEASRAKPEDLLVLASGAPDAASKMLGQLRLQVAKKENMIPEGRWELLWVTDFPLFDWNVDEKRWDPVNHPFTAPREEDLHMLESDPGKVLAKAYDVILNGWELGGGSIRIHDRETQAKVFRPLGLSDEDAKNRFGFWSALASRPPDRILPDWGHSEFQARASRVIESRKITTSIPYSTIRLAFSITICDTCTWRDGGSSNVELMTSQFGPFTCRSMSVTSSGRSSISSMIT